MKILYTLTAVTSLLAACFLFPAILNAQQAGDLDLTFGTGGKVITSINTNSYEDFFSVAIQNDGKIVAAGQSNNSFALVRYFNNGDLDSSFGSGGSVMTAFGVNGSSGSSLAIQNDGKLIVAGGSYNVIDADFALARYFSDGSLDSTFGAGGKVITDFGGTTESACTVVIQGDGKIVLAGTQNNTTNTYYDFALVRYNVDGSLDTSFNSGGIVITDFGGYDFVTSCAIQADGKIVVTGNTGNGSFNYQFALARYNMDGSLDNTFGSAGKVISNFGINHQYSSSVTLQTDGKIVVAGEFYNFAIVRYNSDGSLDNTFGTAGVVSVGLGGGAEGGVAAAMQSDGKIVVAGYSDFGNPYVFSFALLRCNSDGSLDLSFGNGGKVITDFGSFDDEGRALAIQPDGKIVVAGWKGNATYDNFALARYTGETVDIIENSAEINTISFFPNPFTSTVTLSINSNIILENAQLKIYDDTGREIRQLKLKNQKTKINGENLSSGIYFYKVENEKVFIGSGKLIVQ